MQSSKLRLYNRWPLLCLLKRDQLGLLHMAAPGGALHWCNNMQHKHDVSRRLARDIPADIHSHHPSHKRRQGLPRSCLLPQLLQCSGMAVFLSVLRWRALLLLPLHSRMAVSLTVLCWRGLLLLPRLLGMGRTRLLRNLHSRYWLLLPSLLSMHRTDSLHRSHCRCLLLPLSLLSAEWSGHLAESSRALLLLRGLLDSLPRGCPRDLLILPSLLGSLAGGRHRFQLLSMGGARSLPGEEGCRRAELGSRLQRLRGAGRAGRQQRAGTLGSPVQQPHRRCSSLRACLPGCMGCCQPMLHLSRAWGPGRDCTWRTGRPVGRGSGCPAELPAADGVAEAQTGVCRQHAAGDCVMLCTKVYTGNGVSKALTDWLGIAAARSTDHQPLLQTVHCELNGCSAGSQALLHSGAVE